MHVFCESLILWWPFAVFAWTVNIFLQISKCFGTCNYGHCFDANVNIFLQILTWWPIVKVLSLGSYVLYGMWLQNQLYGSWNDGKWTVERWNGAFNSQMSSLVGENGTEMQHNNSTNNVIAIYKKGVDTSIEVVYGPGNRIKIQSKN